MHGRIVPDLDANGQVRGRVLHRVRHSRAQETEQALAIREQQLRLFTDNIPEPVVYLDADGATRSSTRPSSTSPGIRVRIGAGPALSEVVHPDQALTLDDYVNRGLAGESVTYERPVVDVNGRTRWFRARIVPDFHFDGMISGCTSSATTSPT